MKKPKYDMMAVIKAAERRRKRALNLRNSGKTVQEVGDALGVTKQRASELIAKARRDLE